jgi:hypothetical protein
MRLIRFGRQGRGKPGVLLDEKRNACKVVRDIAIVG